MFDESKYFLGKICKNNHEFENSGMSLRLKNGSEHRCVVCKAEKDNRNYEKHKEYRIGFVLAYQKRNKEKVNRKNYAYKNRNKELVSLREKKRRVKKYNTDPLYRVGVDLRNRLRKAFRVQGVSKLFKTMDLTGCTPQFLRQWLQSQFKLGMSWDNYGVKNGWVIDHKKPCCSFDLSDPEQQKQCFHYTNLQPLWRWQNQVKMKDDLKLMRVKVI